MEPEKKKKSYDRVQMKNMNKKLRNYEEVDLKNCIKRMGMAKDFRYCNHSEQERSELLIALIGAQEPLQNLEEMIWLIQPALNQFFVTCAGALNANGIIPGGPGYTGIIPSTGLESLPFLWRYKMNFEAMLSPEELDALRDFDWFRTLELFRQMIEKE